ncbi:MAG: MarC family protein [Armatimonadota bacterium]
MSPPELIVAIGQTALVLLVILDPVGLLPVLAALFHGFTPEERRRSLDTAVLVSLGILVAVALVGTQALALFGVTTNELLIAGGLLFLLLGLDMMFGLLPQSVCDPQTACIVPVASPLLAGPGAITTVLLTVNRDPFPSGYLVAGVAMGITWVILRRLDDLMRLLGERGALLLSKLMGIVIMAIAVSFVVRGIEGVVERIATGG